MNSTRGVTFPLFGDYGLQAVSCSFASMYDAYSKFQLLLIAVSITNCSAHKIVNKFAWLMLKKGRQDLKLFSGRLRSSDIS